MTSNYLCIPRWFRKKWSIESKLVFSAYCWLFCRKRTKQECFQVKGWGFVRALQKFFAHFEVVGMHFNIICLCNPLLLRQLLYAKLFLATLIISVQLTFLCTINFLVQLTAPSLFMLLYLFISTGTFWQLQWLIM